MQVKVNQSSPTSPKTNPNPQQNLTINPTKTQNLNDLSVEQQLQLLQQLLQQVQQQKQQDQSEFVVKSGMKASVIAVRVEQMLLLKKKIVLTALGYAIPVMLDAVMLVRKDYARFNKLDLVVGDIELFEKEFNTKVVTGLRVTLTLK